MEGNFFSYLFDILLQELLRRYCSLQRTKMILCPFCCMEGVDAVMLVAHV